MTVSNASFGIERKIEANSDGYFSASSLPPANGYLVSVQATGFSAFQANDIALHVGENVTVPVNLTVSQQTETVSVSDSAVLVDQTQSGVSDVVSQKQISDLPINGRRVDQFVLLAPGVVADGTNGNISFRGVPAGNTFLQDGNDVTQQWSVGNAGGPAVYSNISQDAVQEFQVQTSGYSAEFGQAAGGVINTVTRSGTNQFHGTAFWYFRNRTLNAKDPFAAYNPPEWRHQAGASIGGPIIKNKLFFFGNVEVTRRNFPLVDSIVNSQFYSPSGAYVGVCGAPATPAQCTAAQNYFNRFFTTVPRSVSQNIGFFKLDWRPNEKNSFSANANIMQFVSPNGQVGSVAATDASGVGANGDQHAQARWARFAYTRIINDHSVNEFRFGWFKDRRSQEINDALAPPNGLRSGLTVQGQGNLGVSVNLPNIQPSEDRFQIADNLSWTTGKHDIKVGVDLAYLRDVENALFNGPGQYTYSSITDFALDLENTDGVKNWQTYTQSFGPLLTKAVVRDFGFFAQDQYRVTRGLTLNYGLRYEYNGYSQPPLNTDYPQTGKLNQPTLNLAPRLGFAWSLNGNRTVIRGGYGIFYDRLPSASVVRLQQRNGVIQKTVTLYNDVASDYAAGPIFPNRLSGLAGAPGLTNVTFAANDLATPYTEQADFGIEHALSKSTTMTVSYMWSRGYKFISREDLNLGPASGVATYAIDDAAGNQTGTFTTPTYLQANRVDPRYASIIYLSNRGRLWYDGLAVSMRHRATSWLQAQLSYTWSHSEDENQGNADANVYFTDPPNTVYNGNYQNEKGNSVLDQRHRGVIAAIISAPYHNFGSKFVNGSLNGWQLSVIETGASPQYVDPLLIAGTLPTGLASNTTVNGMVTPFGAPGRVPFLSRSSLPLGDTIRTDARLSKRFQLPWESSQIELHFEVFNAFNYTTITSVNQNAYGAANGVIFPLAGAGEGIASEGFPDGTNARRAQVSARFTF